jgi:hypothetical protein
MYPPTLNGGCSKSPTLEGAGCFDPAPFGVGEHEHTPKGIGLGLGLCGRNEVVRRSCQSSFHLSVSFTKENQMTEMYPFAGKVESDFNQLPTSTVTMVYNEGQLREALLEYMIEYERGAGDVETLDPEGKMSREEILPLLANILSDVGLFLSLKGK